MMENIPLPIVIPGFIPGIHHDEPPHASAAKKLIPAPTTSPILPSRTRAYGRKRNERLGGVGPGSLRVAAGKAQTSQAPDGVNRPPDLGFEAGAILLTPSYSRKGEGIDPSLLKGD